MMPGRWITEMKNEGLQEAILKDIPPDKIRQNPENPRIFFRAEEMDTLLASIAEYGIQVPITVYEEEDHYVLIDGERRWRCANKLNLKRIPALIHPKPTELDNLLMMFNIHALREQWDYFTIATKLPEVVKKFTTERGFEPNEIELSAATGLTRGQIRRCRILMDLPSRYKKLLVEELSLPKAQQKLSEDFFIEMERSLKTVQGRLPNTIPKPNVAREALISKFKRGVIKNITDFRKLSKIATSIKNVGVDEGEAAKAIDKIFKETNDIGIGQVYEAHFALRYDERRILLSIDAIADYLAAGLESEAPPLAPDVKRRLAELRRLIDQALHR